MNEIILKKRKFTELGKKFRLLLIAFTFSWLLHTCGGIRTIIMYGMGHWEEFIGTLLIFFIIYFWIELYNNKKLSYIIKSEIKGIRE